LLEAFNIEGREVAMPFIKAFLTHQRVPSERRVSVSSVVSVVKACLVAAYDRARLKFVSGEATVINTLGKGMLAGSSYLKLEKLSS
jgi:hypothetical protein